MCSPKMLHKHPTFLSANNTMSLVFLPPTINHPSPLSPSSHILNPHPINTNHNIHAFLLRTIPLVAQRAILIRVPEGADGAVHAAAAGCAAVRGGARVLDDGAVGDVLVGWLGGLGGVV